MSNLLRIVSISLSTPLIAVASATAAAPWGAPAAISAQPGAYRSIQVASDATGTLTAAWIDGQQPHVYTATRPKGSAWSSPKQLDGDTWPVSPKTVSISVSPNGHALASWLRQGLRGDLVLDTASRTPEGAWTAPEPVLPVTTSAPLSSVRGSSLVVTDSGSALGVVPRTFIGDRPSTPAAPTESLTADRTPAGPWTTATPTDGPATSGQGSANVGIDDQGDAVAIGASAKGGIATWTRAAGGAWKPAGEFAPATGTGTKTGPAATDLQLAVSPTGDAVASWSRSLVAADNSGIASSLESARLTKAGTWGPVTTVAEHAGGGFASSGLLGIDAAGHATLAWDDLTLAAGTWSANVFAATSGATGNWSLPTKIASTMTVTQAELESENSSVPAYQLRRAAVGRGGDVALLWDARDGRSDTSSAGTAIRPAGGTWQTDATIFGQLSVETALAVDPLGEVTLVTTDASGALVSRSVSGATAPVAGPKVRISIALIPFGTKICPASVTVNVGGAKPKLPATQWDAGTTSGPRCRVSGDIALRSTTKPGSYALVFITGKNLLPAIQIVRVTN